MALSDHHTVPRHVYQALESPDQIPLTVRQPALSQNTILRTTLLSSILKRQEHIRLIALQPALSKDAPLRIKFLSSTLEDLQGRYDAISYTWGRPILQFPLYVDDGTKVCVTQNLDRALRYLRYKDRDRLLWADAASINQIDNQEKEVQIPLMVKIFQGARKVVAWLDPGEDTTAEQKGMLMMSRLSRGLKIQEDIQQGLSDIVQFFKLPWFRRLWVVQEVVFSQEIVLICGETELSLYHLIGALSILESREIDYNPDSTSSIDAITEVGRLWSNHSHSSKIPGTPNQQYTLPWYMQYAETTEILGLVMRFELYECTDPRDRIFALCSMATDIRLHGPLFGVPPLGQHIHISIDYSLDVSRTYRDFALECWKRGGHRNQMWEAILSRQHSPQPTGWSSWVPDWRVAPREAWLDHRQPRYTGPYPRITVAQDARSTVSMCSGFEENRLRVNLEDIFVVKTKTSGRSGGYTATFLEQLSQMCTLLKKPAILQTPDILLDSCTSTSRIPGTRSFTNLLVDLIRTLLPDTSYIESLVELDQYLTGTTLASATEGSQCASIPPPVHIQELVDDLECRLKGEDIFCFEDPRTQVCSVGCGNTELEPGDLVLPMECDWQGGMANGLGMVFILRKVVSTNRALISRSPTPSYRFVGRGYVFHPTSLTQHYHLGTWSKYLADMSAEERAWARFCHSLDGMAAGCWYLNLA